MGVFEEAPFRGQESEGMVMSLRDPRSLTLDRKDWLVIGAALDFALDNMNQEKAGPIRKRHLELLIEQIGCAYMAEAMYQGEE